MARQDGRPSRDGDRGDVARRRTRSRRRAHDALGATSAAALAGVDLYYAGKRRIKPVYFADAALELAFLFAWLVPRRGIAP
jgi:hypothetical protein